MESQHTDIQKHTQEFVAAWFGPAAPQIHQYLDLLRIKNPAVHAHIYDAPKAAYLGDEFINKADALMQEAEQATRDDTTRFRVRVTRLPIWYVQLATNRVQGQERAALLKQFIEVARKAGISHISEGQTFEDWAKQMQK